MDTAGKQGRKLKLQGELSQLGNRKNEALVTLARAVLVKEGSSADFRARYAAEVQAIADIEGQEASIKKQIEDLSREDEPLAPLVQEHACPVCGNPVTLDARFCPACGDNLAALKAQFKVCPSCNVYYPADARFCEKCGAAVVELEVVEKIVMPQEPALALPIVFDEPADDEPAEPSAPAEPVPESVPEPPVPEPAVCASCGKPLKEGAHFCGSCGAAV